LVLQYSKEERFGIILKLIKSEDFYIETKKGSYEQIAYYTNECIEMFYCHHRDNCLNDGFGGGVYFGYDNRTFDREGLLVAQIKCAAHLVTGENEKKRFLDTSRSNNLNILKETILNAEQRLTIINKKGQLTYNYIYQKNNIYYVAVALLERENLGRITTFLPQNSVSSINKKIASAIKAEAKPTRIKTPSL
jgi:hypothetical protein